MVHYQRIGLSLTQIMILNSISAISIVLLEVPTGVIADLISRKVSLALGSACWTIQLLILIFASNFWMLSIAQFFMALGITFKSGAAYALLYDSLLSEGCEDQVTQISGKAGAMLFYGHAGGSIIAGFTYTINPQLPFIISCINTTTATIIALYFDEMRKSPSESASLGGYFKHAYKSIRVFTSDRILGAIALYAVMFYVIYKTAFYFYQPYFSSINIPVHYFGILFAVFNVIAGLGSQNIKLFSRYDSSKNLSILTSIMSFSFIGIALTKQFFGVLFMFPQQLIRGVYIPIIMEQMNKRVESENRATVISVYSFAAGLAASIFYPISGLIGDNFGVSEVHILFIFIITFSSIFILKYMKMLIANEKSTTERDDTSLKKIHKIN